MKRKKKYKHDYGIKNIYQFYNEKYKDILDYKTFSDVINTFNTLLIDDVYKGTYIVFPYNLGDLFINKYKPRLKFDKNSNVITKNKYKMIDHKATNKLWKKYPELKHKQNVVYDNFHTDGYKFKINWKRYHTFRTHKLYNFIPSRAFRRNLAAYLREHPNQDYYDK